MAAYQSGEFSPPNLNNLGAPPAAGIFQNTLIVFGGSSVYIDGGPKMIQTTLDLSQLAGKGNPAPFDTQSLTTTTGNTSPWNSNDMLTAGDTPYTLARCGAASMPTGVYAFWNNWIGGYFGKAWGSSAVMYAAQYNGAWGSIIQVFESDGKTQPVPFLQINGSGLNATVAATADVSATAFGNKIIMACAQASSANCTSGGIYLGIYDPSTITTKNAWVADWSCYITTEQLNYYGWAFAPAGNTGNNISIDWFAVATGTNTPLQYFLAISFAPQYQDAAATNGAMVYLPLNVGATGEAISVSVGIPSPVVMYKTNAPGSTTETILANPIVRDSASRLRVYDLQDGQAGYFTTNAPPWSGDPLPWAPQNDKFTSPAGFKIGPAGLFYTFEPGQSQVVVDGITGTSYPVYEFIFYNACQVNLYGTIEMIPNPNPLRLQPETISVIGGCIEGPIPMPIENFVDFDPGTNQVDRGDLVYGTQTSNSTTRQLSTTWTKGAETNGEVTKGVGPAWDVAWDVGVSSVSGNEETSCISYPLMVQAIISYKEGQPPTLTPDGAILGISVQFLITGYRFLDAGNNVITDSTIPDPGQSSKVMGILAAPYAKTDYSYQPYAVIPGVLESYKPEMVNLMMSELGYNATDNYYGDIMCTNAYPFTDASAPWLTFSWSGNSNLPPTFQNCNSSYTESSWILEDKVYGGLSGGGGFSVFGIEIEEAQVSALGGVTLNQESTTTETTETNWGISLSGSWGPPISSASGAVKSYEFRLFFLPVPTAPSQLPPTYWTAELIKNLPNGSVSGQTIDPNSACWRIMYVVTRIEYVDASVPIYQYDGSLDRPSVYPSPPSSPKT